MRWRGAVLGFGQVAEHGHWPAWRARADVQLVAVADPDAGRRARAAQLIAGVRTYGDAATLLAAEALDFVDIAAPPADHMPLAAAAATAGCHVLCEKPLATSAADYLRGRASARYAGVRLFPVHNWRHAPQFRHVMTLLGTRAIGALRHVRLDVVRTCPAATAGAAWRRRAAQAGGGILVDHGWHAFYLLLRFAGERPSRVRARIGSARAPYADVEDTAWCVLEFPSSTAEIALTWAGSERRTRWQLTGERGEIVVEDDRLEVACGLRRERTTFAESLSTSSHHPKWFAPVIDEFFREIGPPSLPRRGSGEGSIEAELCLLLTLLAYASAEGGRELRVPEALSADEVRGEDGDIASHPTSGGPR